MTYYCNITTSMPFFRIGEIIGWEEQVPSRSRRAQISRTFKGGDELLQAVEVPRLLTIQAPANLPDIFCFQGGIMIVSQRLHEVLETADPGVHQVLPIEVTDGKRNPITGGPHYFLNVYRAYEQATIIDELSTVEKSGGAWKLIAFPERELQITVDQSRTPKVNLWRERGYSKDLLLADALKARLETEGIKFFEVHKALENNIIQ